MSEQSDTPVVEAACYVDWQRLPKPSGMSATEATLFASQQRKNQVPLFTKEALEKALSTATARIAELERELDCNLQQMQTKF